MIQHIYKNSFMHFITLVSVSPLSPWYPSLIIILWEGNIKYISSEKGCEFLVLIRGSESAKIRYPGIFLGSNLKPDKSFIDIKEDKPAIVFTV